MKKSTDAEKNIENKANEEQTKNKKSRAIGRLSTRFPAFYTFSIGE